MFALSLVNIFKDICRKGNTVLCTIHQPSSEVFEEFDTLILLALGRVVYHGPCAEAVEYFAGLGYSCPDRYNPADYFIKITSVAGLDSEEQEKKRAEIEALCDAWEKNNWPQDPASPESAAAEKKTRSQITASQKSVWQETTALYLRELKTTGRNPLLTKARLGQTVFLGGIMSAIYWRIGNSQVNVQDKNGAMFMITVNQSMMGLFGVLQTFPVE
jgi:ABC-type multidrug transport system ATPase subunit